MAASCKRLKKLEVSPWWMIGSPGFLLLK